MNRETRPVLEACKELVRRVGRAYYEPKYIMILDLLSRNNMWRISLYKVLTQKGLKMPPVDLRKLCAKLKADGLIKMNAGKTEEVKEFRHTKKITKAHYYIDYRSFVNVIKYKMYRIQEIIKKRSRQRDTTNNLEYLLLWERNDEYMFLCEICSTPLEQKEAVDLENDLSKNLTMRGNLYWIFFKRPIPQEIPEFEPTLINCFIITISSVFPTESGAQASRIMVELQGFDEVPDAGIKDDPEDADLHYKEYYANLSRATMGVVDEQTAANPIVAPNIDERPSKKMKFEHGDDDDEMMKNLLKHEFTWP
ncbi:hypothetical protein BC829DRAFT_408124 [Chytridium lagenaria]|nr:hypothetical protein BC829DRAFT_408124 [Chytridium lagenaria]